MPRPPSPLGLHRVLDPPGVLPQAAWRVDATPEIAASEVLVRVGRLNLDAASYRQLHQTHGGDPDKIRAAVLDIVATRGKMQNPVTGSGGMLTGTVELAGPDSPLGLAAGQRIATLVSLTLTPLTITDALTRWDGQSEQVPCEGWAILFARSIAAVLPEDLSPELALAVMDVCGAPALTQRVVRSHASASSPQPLERHIQGHLTPWMSQPRGSEPDVRGAGGGTDAGMTHGPVVTVLGAAGKSGSLSAAAAREAGAAKVIGVVPDETEAALLRDVPVVNEVVVADARDPVGLAEAIGEQADVTVVCVDVPGCEGGAILATRQGGTVIFFSMATSFSTAALSAEGMAADVTMLIGNGYVPGHAELALDLIRRNPAVRTLFERRISA
ncbi:MAG TPA: L-erythro-3,5-diaminohexanoate dehydrogenase [Streptosporangiaceae bacterium]